MIVIKKLLNSQKKFLKIKTLNEKDTRSHTKTKQACGPACLAMVFRYYNDQKTLKEIIEGVDGVKSFGVRAINLAKYARKLDYQVDCYSYDEKMAKGQAKIIKPNKELILKYLRKHIPVIIAVRTHLLWNTEYSKAGHYIVITKYDRGMFWYNDALCQGIKNQGE